MAQNKTVVLDIETAPYRVDEYEAAFPKSKKKPGLHAIVSQVVAVGICVDGDPSVIGWSEFGNEDAILRWLSGAMRENQTAQLVGFNIKNFDLPLLEVRGARYKIPMYIPPKRSPRIVDIYDILGGKWQTDVSACSLTELSWHLYGEGKATNGGDVAKWFAAGEFDKIEAHCLEDIVLTNRIYQDHKGVLW